MQKVKEKQEAQEFYQPAEDSYLIAEALKKTLEAYKEDEINKLKLLDMGCGSGIITETALSFNVPKQNILAVDINKQAVKFVKNKYQVRAITSDLFNKIKKSKENKFDLIVFNPPYLPENKYDKKKDTSGGKKGYETAERFLQQANGFLKESGKILILLSSLTNPKYLNKKFKEEYTSKTTNDKKLFFEQLFVLQLNLK